MINNVVIVYIEMCAGYCSVGEYNKTARLVCKDYRNECLISSN